MKRNLTFHYRIEYRNETIWKNVPKTPLFPGYGEIIYLYIVWYYWILKVTELESLYFGQSDIDMVNCLRDVISSHFLTHPSSILAQLPVGPVS